MVTITLADGTQLSNLIVNGDNFISNNQITADVFENNTSPVIITDENGSVTHDHMELVQVIRFQNAYWFVLRDLTAEELYKLDVEAKLDYIAMMTDVELEDFNV